MPCYSVQRKSLALYALHFTTEWVFDHFRFHGIVSHFSSQYCSLAFKQYFLFQLVQYITTAPDLFHASRPKTSFCFIKDCNLVTLTFKIHFYFDEYKRPSSLMNTKDPINGHWQKISTVNFVLKRTTCKIAFRSLPKEFSYRFVFLSAL